jgi:hypothetical protein
MLRSWLAALAVLMPWRVDAANPRALSGTFLDVAYDGRLKYANGPAYSFSCEQWEELVETWRSELQLDFIIFQAVHDGRWGAYFNSDLPFLAPWTGKCLDVVEAVLNGADKSGVRVFLSSEFVGTEEDSITDPDIMTKRFQIMQELSENYVPRHRSFIGWYFGSEASIFPYFTEDFLNYIDALSSESERLTPDANVFTSPYGARVYGFKAE